MDKVREATRFGARGVVVGGAKHNPEGGDSLVTMYNTGKSYQCNYEPDLPMY